MFSSSCCEREGPSKQRKQLEQRLKSSSMQCVERVAEGSGQCNRKLFEGEPCAWMLWGKHGKSQDC